MSWTKHDLKQFLDEEVERYERPNFIENDPILIPHSFSRKEDIEISGFLTATISWGNRKSIISNATKLMELMDNAPFEFIQEHTTRDLKRFDGFVHRTFNAEDIKFFITSLKNIYKDHHGMESAFLHAFDGKEVQSALNGFREIFFSIKHPYRTEKHVSNPLTGSSAKRLNMFLRWMVRSNEKGVDFGIWKHIPTSVLMMPLDVHTGNVSRELSLLRRPQNDWKALEELMKGLRAFDALDPVKYDYALFGIGVNKTRGQ